MHNVMEERLKQNLKTYILFCLSYLLSILVIIVNKSDIKKINDIELGDVTALVLTLLLGATFSFVAYFLIDFDIHNKFDKIFSRRERIGKRYLQLIIEQAEIMGYKNDSFDDEQANFIFYYIANRQPELREKAYDYWTKIFTFDLYIFTSLVFFVVSIIAIAWIKGFSWFLLFAIAYLGLGIVFCYVCIPPIYKKAEKLPKRQIKDYAISSENDFVNLLVKCGFVKT